MFQIVIVLLGIPAYGEARYATQHDCDVAVYDWVMERRLPDYWNPGEFRMFCRIAPQSDAPVDTVDVSV